MGRFAVVYEPAQRASRGPQPGALALMEWCLTHHPPATNLGIYNNRNVRGGKAMSLHAEGRALDVGFPYTKGGTTEGWALARLLRFHASDLGVQSQIYSRQIWTATKNGLGWRRYNGSSAHYEHIHVELNRAAAANLTIGMIEQTTTTKGTTMPDRSENVRRWQEELIRRGQDLGPSGSDGDFGDLTERGSFEQFTHLDYALTQANKRVGHLEAEVARLTGQIQTVGVFDPTELAAGRLTMNWIRGLRDLDAGA